MVNESNLKQEILNFLSDFDTSDNKVFSFKPISGEFSLYPGRKSPDLYGMLDAVYILFIINELQNFTSTESRRIWAKRILDCQDESGWFSKKNFRGHAKEHASAYAIGALKLLSKVDDQLFLDDVRPIKGLRPIAECNSNFKQWINRLGFKPSINDLPGTIGWNYIWRGSHIGGGVPAIFAMLQFQIEKKWNWNWNATAWFSSLFKWLNNEINPETGYWQRAIWNQIISKPSLNDMAGAVHFYWIYSYMNEPFPILKNLIRSTINLQKTNGLYKNHPFCIDLDGNYQIIHPFNQLNIKDKRILKDHVKDSLVNNYSAISKMFIENNLNDIYRDSHGLPGALAALAEIKEIKLNIHTPEISNWKSIFKDVCWL